MDLKLFGYVKVYGLFHPFIHVSPLIHPGPFNLEVGLLTSQYFFPFEFVQEYIFVLVSILADP